MLIKKNRIPIFQMTFIGILPSFIKVFFYRIRGYKIKKNVKIGIGSVIISKDVEIGENTSIGFGTVIRAEKIRIRRFVRIGSFTFIDTGNFFVDDDSKINEQVIIAGIKKPESSLIMGKRTTIMEYSYINPTMPISIGDDSGIGGHCLLFTHGSWLNQLDGYPVKFAPIKLGKNVWLPWRVFIMPGVEIGNNVVVGADSLINKSFSSNLLIAGSPAKVIKDNFPDKPSNESRNNLMKNIIFDFIEYLKHEGLKVELIENFKDFKVNVTKNNKIHKLFYYSDSNSHADEKELIKNSVAVFDCELDLSKSSAMQLDLKNKTRYGSNSLGEELVKFLSRYGIRFNRKD